MGFNLRGGRPKNMGQGIYWVQRNVADQKAEARSAAAEERRVNRLNEAATNFNEKKQRIIQNLKSYIGLNGKIEIENNPKLIETMYKKINKPNAILDAIHDDVESSSMADLSKLSKAVIDCIEFMAKHRNQKISYDKYRKVLSIDDVDYDFS